MTGRQQHYAHFFGLEPLSSPERDGRPLVLVHGNCQAESLRVLLAGDGSTPVRTVRVPPVHELTAQDLPRLQRVLDEVDVLVSQPVREGYRDLPLGTAELLGRAPRRPRLVVVPVLRWAALHPFQVIVRSPGAGEPPVVPYHDLRTLTVAAGRPELPAVPSARAVRAVRDLSARELVARQERHGALPVVDLFEAAGAEATRTVNHPGNPVLRGLAERVLAAAGLVGEVADPGRTLLDSVHAPVLPEVLDALGIPGPGRPDWRVHGRVRSEADVRAAHLRWYAEHPGVAEAGLARHAEAAAELAA
ncbi:WcbI family polysaccharide biosynthesis putative acetyltransferase [Kineococcus sp. TBRC 1896]|uniref:WcbI family polysaccharide biosynthesis putative acetyltransferase n=1 Tax=Kineococcus mangrovi TaxID=1660183 RepID=A0ABV4HZE6_9ACTN